MASVRGFPFLLMFLAACACMAVLNLVQAPVHMSMSIPTTGEADYGDRYFESHADEKHPEEAKRVRDCLMNKGMHSLWTEPNRGTFLQICQVGDSQWGVRVCKSEQCTIDDEITAFIKNKMSRWDQVLNYLKNNGAIRIR